MSTITEIPASEIVARAEDAVHAADEGKTGKNVPASKEVKAAAKKDPKYDDKTKAVTKRAQEFRGKKNAVAPVTVTRAQAAIKQAKSSPDAIVKAFKSVKDAQAFAGGDKSVETPELVKTLGEKIADPFARGRGLVSIALAMRETKK